MPTRNAVPSIKQSNVPSMSRVQSKKDVAQTTSEPLGQIIERGLNTFDNLAHYKHTERLRLLDLYEQASSDEEKSQILAMINDSHESSYTIGVAMAVGLIFISAALLKTCRS